MKKIISFILLLCMVLSVAACADNGSTMPESTTPEITLQEVYEAGKNLNALLGDHESVYVQVAVDGKVLREDYYSREYSYYFYDSEYMDIGLAHAALKTNHSQYDCYDGLYSYIFMIDLNGMIDMEAYFAEEGEISFSSSDARRHNSESRLNESSPLSSIPPRTTL